MKTPENDQDQRPFQPWIGVTIENYNAVFTNIESGAIEKFDPHELLEAARVLAAFHSHHVGQDQTAAALLIHNLQIPHTLRGIDRSNRRVQHFVLFLSVITLFMVALRRHILWSAPSTVELSRISEPRPSSRLVLAARLNTWQSSSSR